MPSHKILADEHIAKSVARRLESYGIEALHIDDADLKGKSDQDIVRFAEKEGYIILTRDDDFKDIAAENDTIGIIYLTKRLRKKRTSSEVIKVLNSMNAEEIKGEVIHIPWE